MSKEQENPYVSPAARAVSHDRSDKQVLPNVGWTIIAINCASTLVFWGLLLLKPSHMNIVGEKVFAKWYSFGVPLSCLCFGLYELFVDRRRVRARRQIACHLILILCWLAFIALALLMVFLGDEIEQSLKNLETCPGPAKLEWGSVASGVQKRARWPRVIAHPRLPQTRTCGITAYGSSSNTFASRAAHRMDRHGTRQRIAGENAAEPRASASVASFATSQPFAPDKFDLFTKSAQRSAVAGDSVVGVGPLREFRGNSGDTILNLAVWASWVCVVPSLI